MDTIDRRTRTDDEVVRIEAAQLFEELLPRLLRENGALAGRGVRHLGLRPLALDTVTDGSWSFVLDGEELALAPGIADDAMVVELDADQLSDWAQELRNLNTCWVGRDAPMRNGKHADFLAWDTVWRALFDGWPVHEPGAISFSAADGSPLDLSRSFTPDDDDADIAHFLREAGFAHLRGWLDPAAMATIADDIDRALPTYRIDDGRSWWATLSNGRQTCVRLQHFVEHSPTTVEMLSGPVWDRVRRSVQGDDTLEGRGVTGNCIEALVKPLGVVKGLSDLPWHRDCSLGRHTYRCSGVTVGVSVTEGGADCGQLRVIAGSHRANVPAAGLHPTVDLPVVPLPTEVGDLTVHLSCTLHEAQAPVVKERNVMYSGFSLPALSAKQAGSPELATLRDRAHKLTSQLPSTVPASG